MSFALKKSHAKKHIDVKEEPNQFWWIPYAKKTFTKPLESQLELEKIIDRAFSGFKTRVNVMGSSRDVSIVDESVYDVDVEREILEVYGRLMPCILHYSPLGAVVSYAPTSIPRDGIPDILSDLSKMVKVMLDGLGHQITPLLPDHVLQTLNLDDSNVKQTKTLSALFTLINDIFISLDGKIKRANERDRKGTGVAKTDDVEAEPEVEEETGEMGRGLRKRRKRQASFDVDTGGVDIFEDRVVHKRARRAVCLFH